LRRIVPLLITILTAGALVAGLFFGSTRLVWEKAAHICLECIGVG
jgi:hypothetical protein